MDKVFKALLAVILSLFVLVVAAGPAFAAHPDISPTACWNNCGTGGSSY